MTRAQLLEAAEAVASQPTAPLLEHLPRDAVRRLAGEAGLPATADEVGNLMVGTGRQLVLVAHLDHPGFVIEAAEGSILRLAFRGGVRAGVAVEGSPVVLHRPGVAEPAGRAVLRTVTESGGRLRGAFAEVVDGEAPTGGFAVWDVIPFAHADGRITARACDDLLGVAAGLHALVTAGHERASLLCTRAEEVGWFGALEAVRLGTIPPDATVLSLECSPMLTHAPQGGGVIVRVGDLRSIFDPGLTAVLWQRAQVLKVSAQRRLMDGGSCEATVFCARGLRSSGLALPLAGYHNQPDDKASSGPVAESVLLADLEAEAALLASLCEEPPGPADPGWLDAIAAEATEALRRAPL
jgi:putative aminopeptidase FrvX